MAKKTKQKIREEIRIILSTGFITAFGLLMALTWKDVITEYVNELSSISPIQGSLVTAILITIISVIGILIITHNFKK